MSLVGTALGRAAYGAGQIANKYIDQEIDTQKAQAIADIQRNSAQAMDQYLNSDSRREAMRGQAGKDIVSNQAATDEAALASATNDRLNTSLSAVAAQRAGATARATAQNTAHDVAPGGKVIIGEGSNDKKTAGEWSFDAYAQGLKGASKEERERLTEAHVQGLNKQIEATQAQIVKGIGDGTLSNTKPADGKPSTAYDGFTYLQGEMRRLEAARATVIQAGQAARGQVATNPKLDGTTPAAPPPVDPTPKPDTRLQKPAAASEPAPHMATAEDLKNDVAQGLYQRRESVATDQSDALRREQAANITADQIQRMTRKQAEEAYARYGDVLDPILARMLRKKQ